MHLFLYYGTLAKKKIQVTTLKVQKLRREIAILGSQILILTAGPAVTVSAVSSAAALACFMS